MKITVTTTSQTLKEILGDSSFENLVRDNEGYQNSAEGRLTIYNNGSTSIFIEMGDASTVSDGFPVLASSWIEIPTTKMEKINLISETADNTDIRLLNS